MAWESLRPDIAADASGQYRTAVRLEQYRVSQDVLFLPKRQYLPLDAVEKIQVRSGMMNTSGCCGMGFPVMNLIVFFGGERPLRLLLEKRENAQKLAALLMQARSGIVQET